MALGEMCGRCTIQFGHQPVLLLYCIVLYNCLYVCESLCVYVCLQTAGVVFSISNAILGLTLLAWGNSIGGLLCFVCCTFIIIKTILTDEN